MEFTEEHAKRLLSKEWLAKSDSATSTPYLMKYDFSSEDLSCCLLVTDTKSVWAEVLNSKQVARRWRFVNPNHPSPDPAMADAKKEEAWRKQIHDLLSNAHTIGGIAELSFEIVDSRFSDLSFELECEEFKWRWDVNAVGHAWSAEIISKHLIIPLVSLNHLAFSSADAMGEVADSEVEKAVDKLGRTARRTMDTHIKNALSKPRVSTTISRMTAMFNFIPNLPRVTSTAVKPSLQLEQLEPETAKTPPKKVSRAVEQQGNPSAPAIEKNNDTRSRSADLPMVRQAQESPQRRADHPDSATESEGDGEAMDTSGNSRSGTLAHIPAAGPSIAAGEESLDPLPSRRQRTVTPQPQPPESDPAVSRATSKPHGTLQAAVSDSDSSPHRPIKKAKAKAVTSSDEDSEEERKRRVAQLKASGSNAGAGGVKRGGTRQPIKRGGKRF